MNKFIIAILMLTCSGLTYSGTNVAVLTGSTDILNTTTFGLRLEHGHALYKVSYMLTLLHSHQYNTILQPGILYRRDHLYIGAGPAFKNVDKLDVWMNLGKDWRFTRNIRVGIETIFATNLTKPLVFGTIAHRF